jgi:Eukaryotic cytochrome b561
MNYRFALSSSIAAVLFSILPSHSIVGQEYDCSFPDAIDVSGAGDGSFLFRHSIHPIDKTINVELEYVGIGWVGIAFSQSTSMVPNIATIGLPDDKIVSKHRLAAKIVTSVTAIASDTLTNTSITYNADTMSTILRFTKPLTETDETTIVTGSNIILVAYGFTNTLAKHNYRASKTVTLKECVLAGTTAAPALPTPPPVPTPVVAPVAAPTDAGAVTDPGNGRVNRKLVLEGGVITLSILTDSVMKTITVTMVYLGIGWLGFAVSDDILMPNSNAVLAIPTGAEGVAEKYDIGDGRLQSLVTKVTDTTRQQSLSDNTYTQNDTHTVMSFTKPLVDGNEIPIRIDGTNNFLYAYGMGNEFGYHKASTGFALDLAATSVAPIDTSSPNTKALWLVHGILMFISWSILVPLAVGTAMLRNFLPLPTGMWFDIHRILNTVAVVCTIAGFSIAVRNINMEQGSTAKHFSNYKHSKIGLTIFIFAVVQALTGIFRPHLPKPVESAKTADPASIEDGTPADVPTVETSKKSSARIGFEIQHRVMGTVAMIMGWFNVDSGIGQYNMRYGGKDVVAVPWTITGIIVLITLTFFMVDRFRRRNAT